MDPGCHLSRLQGQLIARNCRLHKFNDGDLGQNYQLQVESAMDSGKHDDHRNSYCFFKSYLSGYAY